MVAAPQYASATLKHRTGSLTKDLYFSDVVGALVNWDTGAAGAGTTSPTDFIAPAAMVLTDLAIVTGLTDTTKVQLIINGRPTGDIYRYVPHLTTNALRPRITAVIPRGARVQLIQLA